MHADTNNIVLILRIRLKIIFDNLQHQALDYYGAQLTTLKFEIHRDNLITRKILIVTSTLLVVIRIFSEALATISYTSYTVQAPMVW